MNLAAMASVPLVMMAPGVLKPEGFGSGCMVSYKGRFFFLSVAHVTDLEGLATYIQTNQPPQDGKSPAYGVGAMRYYDIYKVPSGVFEQGIKEFEELLTDFEETLDVTFCEISQPIEVVQPEWDFGAYKVDKGYKVVLNLDTAGNPEKGKLYSFSGWIKQDFKNNILHHQPTVKLGLQFRGKRGRLYYFTVPKIITDAEDYQGCSGAPILDEEGKLVALACSVRKDSQLVFGSNLFDDFV